MTTVLHIGADIYTVAIASLYTRGTQREGDVGQYPIKNMSKLF